MTGKADNPLDSGFFNTPRRLAGLNNSAFSYAVARLFQEKRKPLVLIHANPKEAYALQEDLKFFLGDDEDLLYFPGLGVLPYYGLSPNPETVAARMRFLYRLRHRTKPWIAIVPLSALERRLPAPRFLTDFSDYLVRGEEVPRDEFLKKLVNSGYQNVPLVEDAGSFCKRGGIVDLFTPQLKLPVRLEFVGDDLESLRHFDPETQRSGAQLDDLVVIPAREAFLREELRQKASLKFRERANDYGLGKMERENFLELIKNQLAPPALETYLSLFQSELATLADYLPQDATLFWIEPEQIEAHAELQRKEIENARAACNSAERLIAPEELFLSSEELQAIASRFLSHEIRVLQTSERDDWVPILTHETLRAELQSAAPGENMLRPLIDKLRGWMAEGLRVVLLSGTHMQRLRLEDLLGRHRIPLQWVGESFPDFLKTERQSQAWVALMEGHLSQGFLWRSEKIVLLTDHEVFGQKQRKIREKRRAAGAFTTFEELQEGDYIVHEEHGLGIYRGLQSLDFEGQANDYLLLEYLGGDKLYLPVYRLNLVSRYLGKDDEVAQLDRLGASAWEKSKEKIRKSLRSMAGDLIRLYAERAAQKGHAYAPGGVVYEEFEALFPFEETPDQLKAIEDVNRDMDDDKPMDRLICGDVGFGKTEVAMRAALRAVQDGKQVAVLVPTTVLALQHERSFRSRFAPFPFNIGMLSRFVSAKKQKEVHEQLQNGSLDIVVGTHALLSKDLKFKDLGLLIIDEEHRFGVAQKEKIKKLKKLADVLTLTATPIPRTLNLSLSGIRDLSVINTAPVDRMSIQTLVAEYNDALIREAILRELGRGGQVYFIHNRVQSIQDMHRRLAQLVPEASIGVGHGQMEEGALEEVMIRFLNREFNVFLCTTIVESGLDISSANTMIVNRADTFGLAQLYQLRGRIGRSNLRAYAYLLIPGQDLITPKARARLSVLQRYTELGSGFKIAAHDLEIRGSGNLLGAEQSGHIAAVGYELYMKLLEEAVQEMKGEKVTQAPEPELHLKLPAAIPESYVSETTMRLSLYKRFSSAENEEQLEALKLETQDRFGELPENLHHLVTVMRVRLLAQRAWIRRVRIEPQRVVFTFDQNTPVDIADLTEKIKKEPGRFRWLKPDELAMNFKAGKEAAAFDGMMMFLMGLVVA